MSFERQDSVDHRREQRHRRGAGPRLGRTRGAHRPVGARRGAAWRGRPIAGHGNPHASLRRARRGRDAAGERRSDGMARRRYLRRQCRHLAAQPRRRYRMQVYRDIVEIDLLAQIAATQALLPHLVERGSGKLVFISSIAGKVGVPLRTAYCAAKFGLIGYADALRAELSQSGVDVHVVCPGSVATDVSRNALTGQGERRGKSDKAIDNGIPPKTSSEADRRCDRIEPTRDHRRRGDGRSDGRVTPHAGPACSIRSPRWYEGVHGEDAGRVIASWATHSTHSPCGWAVASLRIATRPIAHPQFVAVRIPIGFQRNPRQRSLFGCRGASLHRRFDPLALVLRHVLPYHRVHQRARDAGLRFAESMSATNSPPRCARSRAGSGSASIAASIRMNRVVNSPDIGLETQGLIRDRSNRPAPSRTLWHRRCRNPRREAPRHSGFNCMPEVAGPTSAQVEAIAAHHQVDPCAGAYLEQGEICWQSRRQATASPQHSPNCGPLRSSAAARPAMAAARPRSARSHRRPMRSHRWGSSPS